MSKQERKVRREHKTKEIIPPSQTVFLAPSEAELYNMLRIVAHEAARLYELRTGQAAAAILEIRSPQDAFEFLRADMEGLDQEQLRTIHLNTKNRVISSAVIYQGSVNTTHVRLAEVFRPAIIDNATAIIVAHNHPSGDSSPSQEDVALTRSMVEAGKLLDLELIDHLVIGRGNFVSLKERRLGFDR